MSVPTLMWRQTPSRSIWHLAFGKGGSPWRLGGHWLRLLHHPAVGVWADLSHSLFPVRPPQWGTGHEVQARHEDTEQTGWCAISQTSLSSIVSGWLVACLYVVGNVCFRQGVLMVCALGAPGYTPTYCLYVRRLVYIHVWTRDPATLYLTLTDFVILWFLSLSCAYCSHIQHTCCYTQCT